MPASSSFLRKNIKFNRLNIAVFILILFHVVGIIGLNIPQTQHLFQSLTPAHLIISTIVVFYFHKDWSSPFYFYLLISYFSGYFVEVIGIQTGEVFGNYSYGDALGAKVFDTPLIIGVNWMLLIYTCGNLSNRFFEHIALKALAGSIFMVFLDFMIEPVAINMDFWHWEGSSIPLKNYLAWGIISYVLLIIYFLLPFNKENRVCKPFYFVQLFFFLFIRIILGV